MDSIININVSVMDEISTKIQLVFRWFTIDSIKMFLSKVQFISSLTTAVGLSSAIKILGNLTNNGYFISIVSLFIVIFLWHTYESYKAYEKTVAEVLETGYFSNFFSEIAKHIIKCPNNKVLLGLKLNDEEKPIIKEVCVEKVVVILPKSHNSLIETFIKINEFKIGNLDNQYWVNFTIKDNKITIYEYPRTLKPLLKYIELIIKKDQHTNFIEKLSEIYHRHFNDKFNKDWSKLKYDSGIGRQKDFDEMFEIVSSIP